MLGLFALQRRVLFPRHFAITMPDAGRDIEGLKKIWITSPEGKVESWFLPGQGVSPDKPGPVVLFAHGNAELIEYWPDMLDGLRRMGLSVFLPEYRGYGRSAGSPSQAAITEDFVQFYDELIKRPEVDTGRIIFIGRSIGGGAVCSLIPHRKPAALILMSTFTSVTAMARRFLMPGFLVGDPFDNLSVVSNLKVPILIIHGRQDNLIPFEHSQTLHQSAPGSKLISYQADHNSCPPDWSVFFHDVKLFLEKSGLL